MSPDSLDQPREAAVEQLEAFGLNEYAARTYVGLVALGDGTAKDISEVSGVPRTRVYDVVDDLERRGLVSVRHSEPRRFWAVSGETASQQFENRLLRRVNIFREAVDAIDTSIRSEEQRGVWTVTDRKATTARIVEFLDAASEEIVFMTVESLLTQEILDSLRDADERGVRIKLGEMSNGAEQILRDEIPGTEVVDSLWDWEDTPAGRVLLVDDRKTLVGVLAGGNESVPPREETAIWGTGPNNNLVVVLQAMFDGKGDNESQS